MVVISLMASIMVAYGSMPAFVVSQGADYQSTGVNAATLPTNSSAATLPTNSSAVRVNYANRPLLETKPYNVSMLIQIHLSGPLPVSATVTDPSGNVHDMIATPMANAGVNTTFYVGPSAPQGTYVVLVKSDSAIYDISATFRNYDTPRTPPALIFP